MAETIFVLGNDAKRCKNLQKVLKEGLENSVVTASANNVPAIRESDTVVLSAQESDSGLLYGQLLSKLEDQVRRTQFFSELIQLFSSSHQLQTILDQMAVKSLEMLGDTTLIVLAGEDNRLRIEAARSKDPEALSEVLMAGFNFASRGATTSTLNEVLERTQLEDLRTMDLPANLRAIVEKYGYSSMIMTPILAQDCVLGAFITICRSPRVFDREDLKLAIALSDFAAIAIKNASLFEELERFAVTDSLTGLYNLRFFDEALARETARAERYSTALSLLMIDVDGFKQVNDTYGHPAGNRVLTEIGKELRQSVRNVDSVFRCGGDEFGVLLPGTALDGAARTAEKIREKLARVELLPGLAPPGHVTVSIGVAEYRKGLDPQALVAAADRALYDCKRSSKNCAKAFQRQPAEPLPGSQLDCNG